MATQKRSGFTGRVVAQGVTLCIKSFNITDTVNDVDVSSTCSSGFHDIIPTLREGTFSFNAFYDGADPPTFNAGDQIEVRFYTLTDPIAHFPLALLTSVKPTVDVTGAVEYSVDGKNMGPYYLFAVHDPSS